MINKDIKETIEDLLKEINYNEYDGKLYWVNPKQGRPLDKPAGSINGRGYSQIKHNDRVYNVARVIWYIHTGEFPDNDIGYKDNNPNNTKWNNLKLVSTEDRVKRYKDIGENINKPVTPVPVTQKRIHKATFTNAEVNKAVEEFISVRTLNHQTSRYE